MQFILSSSELLDNLQAVKSVIQSKNTNPILDNFLFDIHDKQLNIYGSSGDTAMQARMPLDIEEEGSYAVPADKLVGIVKSLPEQPLTFTFTDNQLRIAAENGKYTLPVFDGNSFPKPAPVKEAFEKTISGSQLADAIDKTLYATFKDETRPILTGILFHFKDDRTNFVSSDTRRLIKFSVLDIQGEGNEYVIPPKAANILKNLAGNDDDNVVMRFTERSGEFHFKNFTLTTTLIIGKYPDYELVFPKDNPFTLIVNRELLLNALKRMAIFASKSTQLIEFHLSGSQLLLRARNEEMASDAEEHLPANYEGEDLDINFHVKYLTEMISHLESEDIKMTFKNDRYPVLIYPMDGLAENEEIVMLLMPLTL